LVTSFAFAIEPETDRGRHSAGVVAGSIRRLPAARDNEIDLNLISFSAHISIVIRDQQYLLLGPGLWIYY
jgi:hypothetical protein